ncbi:MAG: protein phosphatase CheZ [Deltaproteobacteria bacterium]|nr:protein phosphatase CheZ [Deltaproteobacteria bacterium]
MTSSSSVNDKISSLIKVTDGLLRGEFDQNTVEFDAEGVLTTLAQQINQMVVNMKTVEAPLSSARESAPSAVSNAKSVVDLMEQSTEEVLAQADRLMEMTEKIDLSLTAAGSLREVAVSRNIQAMKVAIFDIIASQSYQDAARQKMERLIKELNQMRDWLVETLVVLNIERDSGQSPRELQKQKERLKAAKDTTPNQPLDQSLVDDLLAEFGF